MNKNLSDIKELIYDTSKYYNDGNYKVASEILNIMKEQISAFQDEIKDKGKTERKIPDTNSDQRQVLY